mmetsp:Transcript_149977/g.381231  ORF Transcript_149977/g.381231 Transcript_149977/m.381231 type:complete len:237 (-) Transcript_149977:306-1016(-)|eukprot:CAMPEP_0115475224 /NCGR_PEP_ID=MMETSP0271-20121206/54503_1 /TAXON_ID=71861 /ORGANISM="Scrippsiella trochoidea, Strain CCMP3099" /LENGTH=236 /DNA_ID=CAMNT_0002902583 /DNA_START=21 /DNA_END=731 /DNA_ORIENTATION=-
MACIELDKSRIQGFGSDGCCPESHFLKPTRASSTRCDGCNLRLQQGEVVMACEQCNYFLCQTCHPQQQEKPDWFWGSMSYMIGVACEEVTDAATEFKQVAGNLETFMSKLSLTASCTMDTQQLASEETIIEPRAVLLRDFDDTPPRTSEKGTACPPTTAQGSRSKGLVLEAEAEAEETMPSSQAAVPTPQPMEDLLDIGQDDDLLDFSSESDGPVATGDQMLEPRPPQPAATDLLA